MTVAPCESWIGNLSNKELKDLFVFGKGRCGLLYPQITIACIAFKTRHRG
jgi:hypothetical protein